MLVYSPKLDGYFYTPQSQKEDGIEKPFRVKLRLLTVEETAELQDLLVTRTATEVKSNYGMYFVQACYKGITEWENMEEAESKPLAMGKTALGRINTDSLNMIPYSMIEEIGTVIVSVSENPKNISVFADK